MKILIIFLAGVVVGWWMGRKQPPKVVSENNPPKPPPLLRRIKGDGQGEEKRERKEKIMRMFAGKTEIRNDDVQTLLGVSDASATNYLSELEQEGKIEQIGTTGRFVSYRRK